MKVLVTGASSPLGTEVCRQLCDANVEVHGILHTGGRPVEHDLLNRVIRMNLSNESDYSKISDHYDAIIHIAALSEGSPSQIMAATGLSASYLVKRAETLGIGALVHVSSMSVYGNPEENKIGNRTPIRHTTPYGAAKWAAECFLASNQSMVRCSSVRAPAIVGRRFHRHFMAKVVEAMLSEVSEISLSHPDFMFNNLIHESTLAKFLISLAITPPDSYVAFPVSSCDPMPLIEIIENIAATLRYRGRISWVPSKLTPFSIDPQLALSLGLERIPVSETLSLWLSDINRILP